MTKISVIIPIEITGSLFGFTVQAETESKKHFCRKMPGKVNKKGFFVRCVFRRGSSVNCDALGLLL